MSKRDSLEMNIDDDQCHDFHTMKKMAFIYNAINDGWSVTKKIDNYVFTKKHEGRKEVYSEEYLKDFIERNMGPVRAF